jgi:hypothetical protein
MMNLFEELVRVVRGNEEEGFSVFGFGGYSRALTVAKLLE